VTPRSWRICGAATTSCCAKASAVAIGSGEAGGGDPACLGGGGADAAAGCAFLAHHAGRLGAAAGPFREVLAVNAGFAQAFRGMGARQHDLHRQARFVGVAGAQGFERLDRGGEAALAVFGLVDEGRRQGIAEFDIIFLPGDAGEGGHWRGSGVVSFTDYERQYD